MERALGFQQEAQALFVISHISHQHFGLIYCPRCRMETATLTYLFLFLKRFKVQGFSSIK